MKPIVVTNRLTGEVIEWPASTPDEMLLAMDEVHASLDTYKQAKRLLQERAVELWSEHHQLKNGDK